MVACCSRVNTRRRHAVDVAVSEMLQTTGANLGASKRVQMRTFDNDWADQIWKAARQTNNGSCAFWLLALAAIAVTGCRPASLEKGVVFSIVKRGGKSVIEARIKGVKITESRGQAEYVIRWGVNDTHRPDELLAIAEAILKSGANKICVKYDAEAISTRLREVSTKLWPRRKYKITGYCYRELLSSAAKSAGAPPSELALALGHRSTESQGRYARASCKSSGGAKPISLYTSLIGSAGAR